MTDSNGQHILDQHVLISLARARCYRDLYKIPLPHNLGQLPEHAFSSFQADHNDQSLAFGTETATGVIDWQFNEIKTALDQPLDLARRFEQAANPRFFRSWNIAMRRQSGAGDVTSTSDIHADALHEPRTRIYLAANAAPTLVTPHASMLDILAHHAPAALDLPLGEDASPLFREKITPLLPRFLEAAVTGPANSLCLISGATFHTRQAVTQPGRVFFRAKAYAAD